MRSRRSAVMFMKMTTNVLHTLYTFEIKLYITMKMTTNVLHTIYTFEIKLYIFNGENDYGCF